MADRANYAATVRNSLAQLSVANTNRDGSGTLVPLMFAGANGSRIDRIQFEASASTTAGMVRLFRTKGTPGTQVATMTSSTTTVTVTTTAPHGRSNNEKIYMADAYPAEYNVMGASITVLSATQFTYQATVAPVTSAASTVGAYMTTPNAPVSALWKEVAVAAITPTASVPAWSAYLSTATDTGYLPVQLAAGWLIQASTHNAEAFNVTADYGNY